VHDAHVSTRPPEDDRPPVDAAVQRLGWFMIALAVVGIVVLVIGLLT
jgi:hypothetical protein